MGVYRKDKMIKHKDSIFQVIIRDDNKKGFLKVIVDGDDTKYEIPSAIEFLKLSSFVNTSNKIKF